MDAESIPQIFFPLYNWAHLRFALFPYIAPLSWSWEFTSNPLKVGDLRVAMNNQKEAFVFLECMAKNHVFLHHCQWRRGVLFLALNDKRWPHQLGVELHRILIFMLQGTDVTISPKSIPEWISWKFHGLVQRYLTYWNSPLFSGHLLVFGV